MRTCLFTFLFLTYLLTYSLTSVLIYVQITYIHTYIHIVLYNFPGTAYLIPWLAPEIIDQDVFGYDEAVDLYSFAITMLELLHNHPPYSSIPPTKAFLMKMAENITLPYEDYIGKNVFFPFGYRLPFTNGTIGAMQFILFCIQFVNRETIWNPFVQFCITIYIYIYIFGTKRTNL